jgi:hypothetical protein
VASSGGGTASSGGGTASSGGGTASSGGGTASSGGGTSSGTGGGIDFNGGWHIPPSGSQPALIGDGGTTQQLGPGADSSSPGKFGGPANGGALNIVYPPNGVMLPPNTNSIEFHFIPAPGQTLFRLTFHAPTTNLQIFTGCTALGPGCVYTPDATFWSELVQYARGTAPVTYTIEGVNGASPGAVGSSASQTLLFSEQNIRGGIYYWNTTGVIERYDFGYPSSPAQAYVRTTDVGATFCVGCHVMSRQGNRIVVGKDIPSPAPYTMLDVGTKQPVGVSGSANFFSFSPDEQHLLSSNGVSIIWRELVSGAMHTVETQGTMPDWSPDGLTMAFAKANMSIPFAAPGVDSASIQTAHFNGTGFDPPTTLVPFSGQNNYYPAFSPDGQWVLFNRSPNNNDSFSNGSPQQDGGAPQDGELWAVAGSGGTPVRLDKATNPGPCSWPKWAPVLQDYYAGQVLWLTFSSPRAYGLRLSDGQQTQLWMVAFDPARMASQQDPSFPAFWLPFQDLTTGNHIGQWSVDVVRSPCTGTGQGTCAAGEHCVNNRCTPG